MQLPRSKIRTLYIEQVKVIEANLKEVTSEGPDESDLSKVQKQVDVLAGKYQYNEEIGTARYKLYELQALVHYFNRKDEEALDFISQAIETRGASYPRAEKLRAQIQAKVSTIPKENGSSEMTKTERRKKRIGLEGWLAVFIVGLGVSVLYNVINLFSYGSTFEELSSAPIEVATYVTAITPVLWFEILVNIFSLCVAIWLIVLLTKRRQIAKTIAIIFLVTNAMFVVIDYAWASSVFESFNITEYVEEELREVSSDMGRAILAALIWVPYFLVSRRVKATLTKTAHTG